MRSTVPCAARSTKPPPTTPPPSKPSAPRPEQRRRRSSTTRTRPNRPRPRSTRDHTLETRQEETHELLVPMDVPRAKPRLGHRALRVPVTVPAARRSLTTRDVRQLVDLQCFPPRPAGRVGVEVEWLAVCLADPTQPVRPQVVGEAGGGAYSAAGRPAGRTMRRSPAAVQKNVARGPPPAAAPRRWHRAHDAGPLLAAAFANSPLAAGAPSGWRSRRLANWTDVDECRTTAADGNGEPDPVRQWADYALAARVMLIRRDESRFVPILEPLTLGDWIANGHELGFPTLDDVSYHFTTLFPPVRPRGWLEMRMIDSLPDPWWRAAVAVSNTLVCDDTAADAAAGATPPATASAIPISPAPPATRSTSRCRRWCASAPTRPPCWRSRRSSTATSPAAVAPPTTGSTP